MRLSRPALLASLTGVAAATLIGCQQLLITTATVTGSAPTLTDRTLVRQQLETQKATFKAAAFMPAAVSYTHLTLPTIYSV